MLEHRPVRPRRIVRMAAPDRAVRPAFERDEYGAAPAFDVADAEAIGGYVSQVTLEVAGGDWIEQRARDQRDESCRFERFVEADCDARRNVACRCDRHADLQCI